MCLQSLRPFHGNLSQKISGINGARKKKTDLKKDLVNMLFYTTEKNVWQGLCLGRAINVLFCYELDNFLILKSAF